MSLQALVAMLVLCGKVLRVASSQRVRAGNGCRKGWEELHMVGIPRARGCSQVCLRWGTGLAQAQPL